MYPRFLIFATANAREIMNQHERTRKIMQGRKERANRLLKDTNNTSKAKLVIVIITFSSKRNS